MNKQLPERPDLEQLKKQAKDLLNEVRAGQPEAMARVGKEDIAAFALNDAQRVVAREYGFPSWAKLKLHVETRSEDAAEARLIEASVSGDEAAVRALLAERPAIAQRSVFAAAALGNADATRWWLERDRAAATTKGGPRGWEPLLYLCFGRCGGDDAARSTAARALLGHGANPQATWTDSTWPDSPQSTLYGATGVNNYPRLARILLQAGVRTDDGESIYHAAEYFHRESLEVLAEFGANFSNTQGPWGNTPLYFLFGGYQMSFSVGSGIQWLLEHGANPNIPSGPLGETALYPAVRNGWDAEMIARLIRHGADPALCRSDGRSVLALAIRMGRPDVAKLLSDAGARDEVPVVDQFLGACLRADKTTARRFLEQQPDLVRALTPEERRLVHEVAKQGRADALRLMGELGFDLAVTGDEGETALHIAAWHGRAEAVAILLQTETPLHLHDKRFDAPPIGWCEHGSLFCKNPEGDYAAVAEALFSAGARLPGGVVASPEVMAVVRRHQAKLKTKQN